MCIQDVYSSSIEKQTLVDLETRLTSRHPPYCVRKTENLGGAPDQKPILRFFMHEK